MNEAISDNREIIRVEQLSKRFGGVNALSDVSLSIERGEIHALVGENGAGKSTLMKILAGIYQPDSGTSSGLQRKFCQRSRRTDARSLTSVRSGGTCGRQSGGAR